MTAKKIKSAVTDTDGDDPLRPRPRSRASRTCSTLLVDARRLADRRRSRPSSRAAATATSRRRRRMPWSPSSRRCASARSSCSPTRPSSTACSPATPTRGRARVAQRDARAGATMASDGAAVSALAGPVAARAGRQGGADGAARADIDRGRRGAARPTQAERFLDTPWPYARTDAEGFVREFAPAGWRGEHDERRRGRSASRCAAALAGVVGLRDRRRAEVGFWLHPDAQGRGLDGGCAAHRRRARGGLPDVARGALELLRRQRRARCGSRRPPASPTSAPRSRHAAGGEPRCCSTGGARLRRHARRRPPLAAPRLTGSTTDSVAPTARGGRMLRRQHEPRHSGAHRRRSWPAAPASAWRDAGRMRGNGHAQRCEL